MLRVGAVGSTDLSVQKVLLLTVTDKVAQIFEFIYPFDDFDFLGMYFDFFKNRISGLPAILELFLST